MLSRTSLTRWRATPGDTQVPPCAVAWRASASSSQTSARGTLGVTT